MRNKTYNGLYFMCKVMAVNGEIYNHKELIASVQQSALKSGFEPRTGSDCEALLALYERDGLDFLTKKIGPALAKNRFSLSPLGFVCQKLKFSIKS